MANSSAHVKWGSSKRLTSKTFGIGDHTPKDHLSEVNLTLKHWLCSFLSSSHVVPYGFGSVRLRRDLGRCLCTDTQDAECLSFCSVQTHTEWGRIHTNTQTHTNINSYSETNKIHSYCFSSHLLSSEGKMLWWRGRLTSNWRDTELHSGKKGADTHSSTRPEREDEPQ